ncbi:hypothetical protein ACEN4K_05575 [Marinilactibacillus psychrotolerans]|uniref:Uncharacterized protein n=1 Tax=Marinilactibacillus psychrotolerans TaxID=191770 RepID=A0ABW8UG87_9LACT
MNYFYPEETNIEKNQLDRKLSKKELISKVLQLAEVENEKIKELVENEVSVVELFIRPSKLGLTQQQSETIKEMKFLIDWEGEQTYEVDRQ